MKELNTFRQFANETKEETNEIFGMDKNKEDMKIAKALESLEKALFELNFLGVISDNDYNNFWMDKYGELYMDTMGELDPAIQKMYDYEGVEDMELEENDVALDEVINEGIKSAAKEFVDFHVDGNDNEGVQQVTFDEKEYLEPGEYRKGTVKHFKELQNYLNKNKKYEYTSPGGVKYIFTLSGKNIKLKG